MNFNGQRATARRQVIGQSEDDLSEWEIRDLVHILGSNVETEAVCIDQMNFHGRGRLGWIQRQIDRKKDDARISIIRLSKKVRLVN